MKPACSPPFSLFTDHISNTLKPETTGLKIWLTNGKLVPIVIHLSMTPQSHPSFELISWNSPLATNIHHTSIGPSHSLEIVPKTQTCTSGSSSSPHGILVMEHRLDYTNVLFQDAQDRWEDFHSLLQTDNTPYTITNPDSPAASTSQPMTDADEEQYHQAETYLD